MVRRNSEMCIRSDQVILVAVIEMVVVEQAQDGTSRENATEKMGNGGKKSWQRGPLEL